MPARESCRTLEELARLRAEVFDRRVRPTHRPEDDEYCRQFGYDLGAIVHDLREQERVGGRQVVRLSPRRTVRMGHEAAGKPA